jgi:hypothetical protein
MGTMAFDGNEGWIESQVVASIWYLQMSFDLMCIVDMSSGNFIDY